MDNNYGTDLNSSFTFVDGDLNISTNETNMSQAICNRLNTIQDSLNYFYNDYGSVFQYFLGWKGNDKTLEFMRTEIRTTLLKDPRINEVDVETFYDGNGAVRVNIGLNDENGELNFIITGDKIEPIEE